MKNSIAEERIKQINDQDLKDGEYVLYWMEQSQREDYNQALEYACSLANEKDVGVVVAFGLKEDFPDGNLRHFTFMLEGLAETGRELMNRNIKFVLRTGEPVEIALDMGKSASAIVCDRGYLKFQKKWRKLVAQKADCAVFQVECDVVVPVEEASDKEEYAARTIRSKLNDQENKYVREVERVKVKKSAKSLSLKSLDWEHPKAVLGDLNIDRSVEPVSNYFKGGTSEAKKHFKHFLENAYHHYDGHRQKPEKDDVSFMSMYLHFGQISPLYLLEEIKNKRGENREAFVEELLVRRELAVNFCYHNEDYDSLKSIPDWAQETLEDHKNDQRDKVYTAEQLENAETHDEYWNAAMKMMKMRGYLHNHMRMYWGKQILLYTNTPQYAHKVALDLHNKYFLDGRDCNSYANIAWLFGNHDRGWGESEVFGKVRSMTKSGLERKIDTEAYLDKVKGYEED